MGWPQYLVLFWIFLVKVPFGAAKAVKKGNDPGERFGYFLGETTYYMMGLWVLYMGGFFGE